MSPSPLDQRRAADWRNQCLALIPCFNEAAYIGAVVSAVKSFLPHVLVVDDGSSDATAAVARSTGAMVLPTGRNAGKGCALRAGWLRAQELGFPWVLMLDGDGQHAPEDIPLLLHGAEAAGATLVVGNRMADTGSMPWIRRWVNGWMSRRISQLVGKVVPDSQCGFRLARLDLLLSLPMLVNRFEVESAMLAAFFQDEQRVAFVPVKTIYHAGGSKIDPLADGWRWLCWRRDQRAALRACMTMRVP